MGKTNPVPSSMTSAAPTLPWNQDLRSKVLAALTARGCSRYQASHELGWDFTAFNQWLDGKTVPRPKTVRRAAGWLLAPAADAARWEAGAVAHLPVLRWGGTRSAAQVCAVCGRVQRVRLAQLRQRRKYDWTCSAACRRLVMLKPRPPQATLGNYAAFEAVRRAGSSNAFQRATGLSKRAVHQLCTDPRYAPAASTLAKLAAAITDTQWASLFPTQAADKSAETIKRFHTTHPKGSTAAKRIYGDLAGQARTGQHFPKLSEAQRQRHARKKQQDPGYGQAVAQRLARGQQRWQWRALHLLFGHLRVPRATAPRQRVFRSRQAVAPADVPDARLREWTAADAQRTGIPQNTLLQIWKSWLGITRKGGRPPLIRRLELVEALRKQRLAWKDAARQVSQAEGREIDADALQVWYHRTSLRRTSKQDRVNTRQRLSKTS